VCGLQPLCFPGFPFHPSAQPGVEIAALRKAGGPADCWKFGSLEVWKAGSLYLANGRCSGLELIGFFPWRGRRFGSSPRSLQSLPNFQTSRSPSSIIKPPQWPAAPTGRGPQPGLEIVALRQRGPADCWKFGNLEGWKPLPGKRAMFGLGTLWIFPWRGRRFGSSPRSLQSLPNLPFTQQHHKTTAMARGPHHPSPSARSYLSCATCCDQRRCSA
jgi:hypothetical protein